MVVGQKNANSGEAYVFGESFFFWGGGKMGLWEENKVLGEMVCWDFFSWEHWFAWENGFSEETVLLSKIGLGDNGPLGGKVYLCRFIYIHYKGLGFGRQKGFVRIFCWGGGHWDLGGKYFGTENRLWRKCVFFGGGRKVGIWRKWVREEMEFWRKRGLGRKRWFWEEERGFEDSGVCEENRRIDFGGNRVWG